MCVCVCVIYITQTHTHIYISFAIHPHTQTQTQIHTHNTYTHPHTHTLTYTHLHTHTNTQTQIHTQHPHPHTHTPTHTHTHTYTHLHTHEYICKLITYQIYIHKHKRLWAHSRKPILPRPYVVNNRGSWLNKKWPKAKQCTFLQECLETIKISYLECIIPNRNHQAALEDKKVTGTIARNTPFTIRTSKLECFPLPRLIQGILKGEVSLYHSPPVWLVWISLFCK